MASAHMQLCAGTDIPTNGRQPRSLGTVTAHSALKRCHPQRPTTPHRRCGVGEGRPAAGGMQGEGHMVSQQADRSRFPLHVPVSVLRKPQHSPYGHFHTITEATHLPSSPSTVCIRAQGPRSRRPSGRQLIQPQCWACQQACYGPHRCARWQLPDACHPGLSFSAAFALADSGCLHHRGFQQQPCWLRGPSPTWVRPSSRAAWGGSLPGCQCGGHTSASTRVAWSLPLTESASEMVL